MNGGGPEVWNAVPRSEPSHPPSSPRQASSSTTCSPGDYHAHLDAFLAVLGRVAAQTLLLNGLRTVRRTVRRNLRRMHLREPETTGTA